MYIRSDHVANEQAVNLALHVLHPSLPSSRRAVTAVDRSERMTSSAKTSGLLTQGTMSHRMTAYIILDMAQDVSNL